jgi:glucose/arabinose dehydrogenase
MVPWQAWLPMRATRIGLGLVLSGIVGGLPVASCTSDDLANRPPEAGSPDATVRDAPTGTGARDALPPISPDAMAPGSYCALPGSLVGTPQGMAVVEGGDASLPDLSWLTVPTGFCLHHFANVPETRQLRTGPGGDLFVASPGQSTAGGAAGGRSAILVLPDDDHDGLADSQQTFVGNLMVTQGMTFARGYFYFQDGATIRRVAFTSGDRTPSAPIEPVTTITAPQSLDHFPKVVDVAQDGTVYVANGSDQGESCLATRVVVGAIFKVLPDGTNSVVTSGFRNPIALRCEANHNVCLVAELAKDGSGGDGGREKIVAVRQGDNWGFPCCAAANVPYSGMEFQDTGQTVQPSDCANVTPESVSFEIGHTPFGIDFETGNWPAPWGNRAFVSLHGVVGSYDGSRVVGIALDPKTGLPLPSSDVESGSSDAPNMMDFVTGWDTGTGLNNHGRATAVTFGSDGRMYVGDDTLGEIFWVAPVGLMRP